MTIPIQFAAFDLEIARVLAGDFSAWKAHRPLGISCAAVYAGGEEPQVWFGQDQAGQPAGRMSREETRQLVMNLVAWVEGGYQILTWNGLGFDFDVLAEESGMEEECRSLALTHVDMMFHIFCLTGYPLALDKAAKGMQLSGKLEGITGDQAPVLWQRGDYQTVLRYVAQDARTTLEIARAVERSKGLSWISSSGRPQRLAFPQGWLTVPQALKIPVPDTSWMRNPLRREEFLEWTIAKRNS